VIGAETFSRLLDWTDRGTCVLFGDGAGAVVMDAQELAGTHDDRGVLIVRLRSDGRHKMKLYVDGGPSSTGTVGHLRMEGREVFRHAVAMITDVVEDAFKATGYTAEDIDWFIPHQANKRIIDAFAATLSPACTVTLSARSLGIARRRTRIARAEHADTAWMHIPLRHGVAARAMWAESALVRGLGQESGLAEPLAGRNRGNWQNDRHSGV
jgi:3-oxoacyl-[acyl-carrier-protein] synthase-3